MVPLAQREKRAAEIFNKYFVESSEYYLYVDNFDAEVNRNYLSSQVRILTVNCRHSKRKRLNILKRIRFPKFKNNFGLFFRCSAGLGTKSPSSSKRLSIVS